MEMVAHCCFRAYVRSMHFIAVILLVLWTSSSWAMGVIVKDGDTIKVAGVSYRLDGIDAPEFDQMCIDDHADPWSCGVEARDKLVQLIGKRDVKCEDLGPDKTYKNRHIGICAIAGETMSLNQMLVEGGFALNFEPHARGRFKEDEANAKRNVKGLWRGCFVAPQDFRHWEKQAVLLGVSCRSDKDRELRAVLFPDDPAMPPGCSIKAKFARRAHLTGNVGIYHFQRCRSYAALTKPDRWFCSEEDAQAAGFRKAYNCRSSHRQK